MNPQDKPILFKADGTAYEPMSSQERQQTQESTYQTPPPLIVKVGRDWFDIAGALIALVTFIVVAAYTYYARGQWQEMIKATQATKSAADTAALALQSSQIQFLATLQQMQVQTGASLSANKISRESLESIQRAYIAPHESYDTTIDQITHNAVFMNVSIRWDNTGNTPTKGATGWDNYVFDTHLPDVSKDLPGSNKTVRTIVASKGFLVSKPIRIPPRLLAQYSQANIHLYMWGWMRYHDIFKGTPEHITRYCYEYSFYPTALEGANMEVTASPTNCPVGNCQDEECKEK